MKKKLIALLVLGAMALCLLTAVKPMKAEAATGKLRVGYSTVNIDPIDKEGKYRNVDYTYILEASGNAALKSKLADAGITLENPIYTVPTLQVDCDGNGTKDDGYFSVPLAGYGNTYNRMSTGKMDENGDGKIDNKDGMFATCIAITDEQGNTMLFFTLDLIAATNSIVADSRKMIQEALKETYGFIPQDHIMFTASHSHSSPDTGLDNSTPLISNGGQRAYIALIKDRFVEAAQAAMADRSEATVQKGEVKATNMNGTRHYNAYEENRKVISGTNLNQGSASWVYGDNFGRHLPTDEEVDKSPILKSQSGSSKNYYVYEVSHVSQSDQMVQLVQFTPTDGKAPIVMVNFRAHPKLNSTATTQYGLDNRSKSSADFVAPLREKLEKYGYRAAYIQGASGNQNTWSYIDDGVLVPRATDTYSWMMERHTIEVNSTTTYDCYNDRMSFIKYTSPSTGKQSNTQTGYSYGCRLADYVLAGLDTNMSSVTVGPIQTEQRFFTAEPQVYSDGLKAAVAAYDKDTNKTFPYKYLHTDGKYYNLNSIYHANAVRSRSTNASLIDAKLEINCVTIGNLAFLTAPNELYDRYNLGGNQVSGNLWDNLKDEGFGTPVFMGYANGSEGYIPNVAAYQYNQANNDKGSVKRAFSNVYDVYGVGAYEANTSKFAAGAGEALCKTFETMLQDMKKTQRPTTCPMCGQENVTWEALSDPSATAYSTGHYYLADDLVYYAGVSCFQKTIYNGNAVCIDLNGHTIANSSNVTGRAFYVSSNATLRLMNGTVKGRGMSNTTSGGVIHMDNKSTLYTTNVDIVRETYDGQTTTSGGAIYTGKNCTLRMTGGSVTGGQAQYYGGCIYVNSNTNVNFKDVSFSDGSAQNGGNLYFSSKVSATLENVRLEKGTASQKGDNLMASSASVHLLGNSVIKGECYFSGGTPKISGNVHAWQSPDGVNIKLLQGTTLTFGELASTARIGITGKAMVTDATALPYANQIVADSGYLDSTFSNGIFAGELRGCACRGKAASKHTCEVHAWTIWDESDSLPTVGNYYLNRNVTLESQASVHSTLRLDLNGKTITRKVLTPKVAGDKPIDTRVWYYGDDKLLTITDTVGTGSIKRDAGALSETEQSKVTDFGVIVCLGGKAEFRLFGGTLNGQDQTTGGGGAIAGTTADNVIAIYGGTVKGVTGNYGGGIFSKGTVNLYGGTVTDGKSANGGGGVFLSENGHLTLAGDATVTGNVTSNDADSNILAAENQLTVSGTYTGTAGIRVESPAEGKQVGLADGAIITKAHLTVDGSPDYKFFVSGNQLKLTKKTMEAFVTKGTETTYFDTLEEAIAAHAGGTVHLVQSVDRDVTFTADTQLELGGCSITGKITLTNATLQVSDNATADYTVADGAYGKLPAMTGISAAQGYVMVPEENGVSFHKLGLDLTSVSLRPEKTGIYYSGKFSADEMAAPLVTEYGIAVKVGSTPTEAEILADTSGKMHYACKNPTSGINASGVLLQNILKTGNSYATNKYNAGVVVYGVAYAKTTDGTVILGQPVGYSLRNVIQAADAQWEDLTTKQKDALTDLYETYNLVMSAWDLKNTKLYSLG